MDMGRDVKHGGLAGRRFTVVEAIGKGEMAYGKHTAQEVVYYMFDTNCGNRGPNDTKASKVVNFLVNAQVGDHFLARRLNISYLLIRTD